MATGLVYLAADRIKSVIVYQLEPTRIAWERGHRFVESAEPLIYNRVVRLRGGEEPVVDESQPAWPA